MNRRFVRLFTNRDDVVKHFLENMNIDTKAKIKHTPENELAILYWWHGVGQYINRRYGLRKNKALVKSIGKETWEGAAMAILKEVWTIF